MSRERFEDGQLVTLDEHMRGTDASEPFPAIFKEDGEDDDYLLSPEEFDLLTPQEKDDYLTLLGVQLGKTWNLERSPKQMLANALANKVDYLYYGGAAGGGKGSVLDAGQIRYHAHMGQPLTADRDVHVCTPFGFKLFRDVKVGDQISNPDGTVQRVIALHELGDREIFRVSFVDGATTLVTGDHLWLVNLSGKRLKAERRYPTDEGWTGKNSSIIMTTEALKAHLEKCESGPDTARPHWPLIPLTEPVEFSRAWRNADFSRPIPPYLLGVLIGDGYLGGKGQPSFYSADPEIAERVRSLGDDLAFTQRQGREGEQGSYRLSDFGVTKEQLGRLDLLRGAAEKHLPKDYLEASLAVRWELARGLFDTDGTADARGHVSYTSISRRLIDDVAWLVRSLGFKATITDRIPTYTLHGEKLEGQRAYTAYVQGDRCADLFHLERKRERCRAGVNGGDRAKRRMVKIESIGYAAARCITVDNPNGLYITDDFIVTHNSEMACYHAHDLSMRYPGHVSLVLRTTLPELRRSLIRRMQQRLIELGMARDVKLRKVDNLTALYYPNGSIIEFGYCSNDEQVTQYLSAEYDLLVMDEASRFTPYAINMISSRVRTTMSKRAQGVYPHTLWLSNPGGKAHLYLRKFAFDSTEAGKYIAVFDSNNGISPEDFLNGIAQPVRMIEMPEDHTGVDNLEIEFDQENEITVAFVSAKVSDNPYIDSGYVRRLRGLSEVQRRQFLEGDMRVAEGTAFPEFDPAIHVVEPFDIPESWQRACGIDYGYAKPACCVWGAWSPEGDFYIYRESKLVLQHPTEQAKNWVKRSRYPSKDGVEGGPEVHSYRNADPSAHRTTGARGVTVAIQWREGGWHTKMAPNSRVAGWSNLHAYLAMREDLPPDEPPRPHLRVFSDCKYVIEQLAEVPVSPSDPEDVDTTSDDHGADAIRYLLQGRPIRAVKRKSVEQLPSSHLEARLQKHIDKLSKRGRRQ